MSYVFCRWLFFGSERLLLEIGVQPTTTTTIKKEKQIPLYLRNIGQTVFCRQCFKNDHVIFGY